MTTPRACKRCGAMIEVVPRMDSSEKIALDLASPVYDIANGKARGIHGFVDHARVCTGPKTTDREVVTV